MITSEEILEKAKQTTKERIDMMILESKCRSAGICWECGSKTSLKSRWFLLSADIICPKCGKIGRERIDHESD